MLSAIAREAQNSGATAVRVMMMMFMHARTMRDERPEKSAEKMRYAQDAAVL